MRFTKTGIDLGEPPRTVPDELTLRNAQLTLYPLMMGYSDYNNQGEVIRAMNQFIDICVMEAELTNKDFDDVFKEAVAKGQYGTLLR
jgi:hypothetical protein